MDSSDNFAAQVIFQKSPVTKFRTRVDALIRGQVHEETEGVLDFFCEGTYDTEEQTSSVVVEVTTPNRGYSDDSDDADALDFFENMERVEMQLQLTLSSEFRKWARGEASVLNSVLIEVSNEEFSEIF